MNYKGKYREGEGIVKYTKKTKWREKALAFFHWSSEKQNNKIRILA